MVGRPDREHRQLSLEALMLSSAVDIIFELVNYIVMGANYLGVSVL
ncbi:hypothetical protein [Corynebacterium maris]|nr:hypothetical protein [Corynebacterium maris]